MWNVFLQATYCWLIMPKMTFDSEGKLNSLNDEPAIIHSDGTKEWYKDDKLHRDNDEPAIIYSDGTKEWYKDGKRHRDNDEPVFIHSDGSKEWYKDGKRHRDNDEPAVINSDVYRYWYINGIPLDEKQIELLKKINASEIQYLPWLLNEDELLNSVIERRINESKE
jgi:hypothetical protein